MSRNGPNKRGGRDGVSAGKRAALSGLVLAAACGLCGCAAGDGRKELPPDGATGWTDADFVRGTLTGTLDLPVARAFVATRAAMEAMGLLDIEGGNDAARGRLSARTADGERVRVDLIGDERGAATSLSIRVGTIGDEARSRELLARARERSGG